MVEPQPGESFASWVDRMAVRNGCPPWTLVESLGLDVRAKAGDVRSLAYGVVANPETYEAIKSATGVDAKIVRGMHLEVFDGSAVNLAGVRVGDKESVRRAELREGARFFDSRACAQCLAARLHAPETLDDLDLPKAALLLAGEGQRPWQRSTGT
ncbi:TniQ family protein [Streptosporangium sp. NPDC006013]|uniref:TniQ family protein n=1 Tax=Streptosporangium sp. NPDC006013 TaxID=3155596 RepID=UPI0033BE4C46